MKTVTIGRNSSNDVVISDAYVSGNHCTITLEDNGNYFLRDLGSSNGTYVNGKRVQQAYLQWNDIVKAGETVLPWREYFESPPGKGITGTIVRTITIGRAADNDVVLPDEFISSHHAELTITDRNEYSIHDLGSTNGTFVNDRKLQFSPLLPGDRVRLGKRDFDWLAYAGMMLQTKAVKRRRKVKPWLLAVIITGSVIIAAGAGWGIYTVVNGGAPDIISDSIAEDSIPYMEAGSLPEMVKYIEKSVFLIKTYGSYGARSQGTGFFIDEFGLGVTNYHVIEGGKRWSIKTIDGREYEITEFLERNKEYDYAVFRVDNKGERFNWLKRSPATPDKGDEIFVLGNPQGMESTLTKGIVSSLRGGNENDIVNGRFREGNSFIQIDVAVSHGSSGSPVMNMKGEVVGIATLSFEKADCINCNFAVNIQKVSQYMKTAE